MAYRVEITDTLDTAAATALWQGARTATVFNHPGWWQAAIEAFGPRRRLLVVWVHDAGTPVGLWAFWQKRLGLKETFARVIEPVGARVTDYVQPVVASGHDITAVTRIMIRGLSRELDPHTMLLLPKIPAAIDVETIIAGLPLCVHRKTRTCPVMALPATVDALDRQLPKRLSADIRRQTKRITAFGPLDLQVASTADEITRRLPNLCQIHTRNWNQRTGVAELAPGSSSEHFLRALARHLCRPPRHLCRPA